MAMSSISSAGDQAQSGVVMAPGLGDAVAAPRAVFDLECLGPDGEVKWSERVENTVFTQGKIDLLNVYFGATAKPAAWYLVLKGAGTEVAADTLASHASWAEQAAVYSATNRPTVTFGAASASGANGQIVSAAISVPITSAGTVAGCGLCQTQVKATTTGILYNAGDFASSRSVQPGDTLSCTVTLTQT